MKTLNGLKFGFTVVASGQRSTVSEPQLIANSTQGGFRLTGAVTQALMLSAGSNLMFISNVADITTAIETRNEELVQYCTELGLDIASPEAFAAIHKEFDAWVIAKGVAEKDSKGNPLTRSEIMTKKDKAKYLATDNNFNDVLETTIATAPQDVVDALTREGVTIEEQTDILMQGMKGDDVQKFSGSKLASTSSTTGIGAPLTLTDSNVWNQLKADLADPTSVNRVFEIDLTKGEDIEIHNGFEYVTVKAYPLGVFTDKEPVRVGTKQELEEANGVEDAQEEVEETEEA